MKNKNLLWNLVVGIGLVLMIVGICLSIWTISGSIWGLGTSGGVGIFADHGSDNGTYALIAEIALVASLALVGIYLVVYALELAKVAKNLSNIRRFISLVVVLLAIVAVVMGIVYVAVSQSEVAGVVKSGVSFAAGFYLFAGGALLSGIFGVLGSCSKSTKKSKK